MSLFFGDFSTEDTLPPSFEINAAMFFTCPACGACVVDMEYTETNRRLHEQWHADHIEVYEATVRLYEAHTENLIERVYELEGGDDHSDADVWREDWREEYHAWQRANEAPTVYSEVPDPDTALMEAAKESNRQVARRMEQRLLDMMRNPDDPPPFSRPT